MTARILVVGATGLFGGHLARQLIADHRYDVYCAGRNSRKLTLFSSEFGGTPFAMDRANPFAVKKALSDLKPFAVVDVAGPFQEYGKDPYEFARACINFGAHYIDIADAPLFVKNIGELDTLAKKFGVVAISGASSTPALSSAVVDSFADEFRSIDQIETFIVPGNRTPRGKSVMRAILGQVGQPFQIRTKGKWQTVFGWSQKRTIDLEVGNLVIKGRRASLVNTPDVTLFAKRYDAGTVKAYAGLELALFHNFLSLSRFLVQSRLLTSLKGFTGFGFWLASFFENTGSDTGGMQVRVTGKTHDERNLTRVWNLIAPDGQGPRIPVQPIAVILGKLVAKTLPAGARPCVGEIKLSELELAMAKFGAMTA